MSAIGLGREAAGPREAVDSPTRRDFFRAGGRVAASATALSVLADQPWVPSARAARSSHVRVVPLGTQAGPALVSNRKQPALALVVGPRVYLIDAGMDVVRQLVGADISFADLAALVFTHYHSDHIAGYPSLLALGSQQPYPISHLDVYGPPPLARMHGDILDFFAVDDASRQSGQALPPLASKATVHEIELPAAGSVAVFDDGVVVCTATRVNHGADVPEAYAYRFDVKQTGTSVVFSGDTTEPVDGFITLMQGADVLVHEAMYVPALPAILLQIHDPAERKALRRHLLESHTDVTKLPAIAKEANVGHVALTYFVPVQPDEVWRKAFDSAARKVGYKGGVTVLHDLKSMAVPERH